MFTKKISNIIHWGERKSQKGKDRKTLDSITREKEMIPVTIIL